MRPRRNRTGHHVALGLLFVAGGLLLAVFANLTSTRIQTVLDRLPVWLYLIAMAALLAGGVAATILYERITRRTGRDSATSTRGDDRERLPARQPSRRALAVFGLGTAAAGVTAGAAAPRLLSWLTAALDQPVKAQAEEAKWRGLIEETKNSDTAVPTSAVILWNTTTRERLGTLIHPGTSVQALAFSPDSGLLATGGIRHEADSKAGVMLWNVPTRENFATFAYPGVNPQCLAFSPDGKTLAAGLYGDKGSAVALWSTATQERIANLTRPGLLPWSVAFSPDGGTLAVGGGDGDVHLWTKRKPE